MQVIWQPKAVKQWKKIGDRKIQGRILKATKALEDFHACKNVIALTRHEYTVKKRDERTY